MISVYTPIYQFRNNLKIRMEIERLLNGFMVGANPVSMQLEETMKTIKIELEYKCYPMWVYDENGDLLDNAIVQELADEIDIVNNLDKVQELFNQLYEDTEIIFQFKGLSDDREREQFNLLMSETVAMIKSKIGSVYKVECGENYY